MKIQTIVRSAVLVLLPRIAAAVPDSTSNGWPQWGRNPQHTSAAAVPAQPLRGILADVAYDPFAALEIAEGGDDLLVHFPAPLVVGTDVYVESKSGQYVPCDPPGSGQPFPCGPDAWDHETWNVTKFSWRSGSLVAQWTFASDWKPEPDAGALVGFEPVFQSVVVSGFIYVPGFAGTLHKVSTQSGSEMETINPFPDLAPSRYVAGGLAADQEGRVFYDVIELDGTDPWGTDVRGSWLVRVAANGDSATPISSLVSGAPLSSDLCRGQFSNDQRPWPPSPTAVPPSWPCGSQRVALNAVPAIAEDGTIYLISRAHFNPDYGYLVAVHPDLTPAWSASLRGILDDGCGVLVPYGGSGCREGAAQGVDPATNDRPAGRVLDRHTSSPVVLPDGAVLYAAKTGYNEGSGHLFKFGPDGSALATYAAGFDVTPAVFEHDRGYSIILKHNAFGEGVTDYYLLSLDADLVLEWTFTNTNTESCRRESDGAITCVDDHPHGFEWCVNQPAVDADGVTYANSDDGFLYAIDREGQLFDRIFLDVTLGAAYTPVSIGPDGRIYAQNSGHLLVVGIPIRPRGDVERTEHHPGNTREVVRP